MGNYDGAKGAVLAAWQVWEMKTWSVWHDCRAVEGTDRESKADNSEEKIKHKAGMVSAQQGRLGRSRKFLKDVGEYVQACS